MKNNSYPVKFYRTESGNEPVRVWLKNLPREDKKIIGEDIKTLQFGWPIGMPLVRHMRNKLWEIRINLSKRQICRILFTLASGEIILLHGFIKKSQQTPRHELEIAIHRQQKFIKVPVT